MNNDIGPYRIENLSPGRRIWINALHLSGPTCWMYGLLEADVTLARQLIADHKARSGDTLSFTGFLIYCLARAVAENKEVQSYLKGRRQVIQFDDVHVGMMVENNAGGKKILMGHIIQAANRKSYQQIHQEIRTVQNTPAPASRGMPGWFRSALLLPWPLSNLIKAFMAWKTREDPTIRVAASGTVFISSVGMFGKGHSGWGISTTPHSCGLMVGTTTWKPAVVNGRIEPRQILNLTVLFDHDVIDGAPAARFTSRLVELIESGYGLYEPEVLGWTVAETGIEAPSPLQVAAG